MRSAATTGDTVRFIEHLFLAAWKRLGDDAEHPFRSRASFHFSIQSSYQNERFYDWFCDDALTDALELRPPA